MRHITFFQDVFLLRSVAISEGPGSWAGPRDPGPMGPMGPMAHIGPWGPWTPLIS
jgi:hypothetical protein